MSPVCTETCVDPVLTPCGHTSQLACSASSVYDSIILLLEILSAFRAVLSPFQWHCCKPSRSVRKSAHCQFSDIELVNVQETLWKVRKNSHIQERQFSNLQSGSCMSVRQFFNVSCPLISRISDFFPPLVTDRSREDSIWKNLLRGAPRWKS